MRVDHSTALLSALTCAWLAACSKAPDVSDVSDASVSPEARTVEVSSQAVQVAVQSNSHVASELHRALRDQNGNLFYSPLSIEAVLGMLYAGAAGETASQIGTLLDPGEDAGDFHAGFGSLLSDLAGDYPGRGYTLSLANRLFGTADMQPSAEFVDITENAYRAPLERTDFQQPEAARQKINRWVAKQTHDRIPELFLPGQVDERTLVALVNAVYFKARWSTTFEADATTDAPFRRADGSVVDVKMMRRRSAHLRVGELGDASLVELGYGRGDVSFLGLLPRSNQKLDELEANLDLAALEAAELSEREAVVRLPRFELKSRLDLIPVLKSLGVRDVFDDALADLKPMDPRDGLYVDPFVHEAWVKVDEEGTEAAAATGGAVEQLSLPPSFVFDHPFLFFIRDNLTGTILFTGRVSDPSAS